MEPKKKRIRLHRGLTFALAIVLTVVIAVVVFQRSGILSYQLSKYINDHYFRDTPFSFSCGKISGDLVGHVSLANPVIRYEVEDRTLKVFAADRITIDYDLFEILKLRMMVSHLALEGVRVSVWNDEEGKPILPIPAEVGEASDQTVSPHVEVDRFSIEDLEFAVETAETTYTVENLDLSGSLRYVDGKGEVEIDHGRARLVETDTQIQSLRAEIEVSPGAVAINRLVFRLDESFVMVSGKYENEQFHHVQGVFNPLSLDELSSLGVIDEQGEVAGSVVVEGALDSLAVRGSLTGRGLGLVFSGLSFEGVITPDRVHLSPIEGQVFGTRLRGDVTYARATGGYTFAGDCRGLDISHGFLADRGVPETDLNGSVYLDHDGVGKSYEVRTVLERSTISGFESEAIEFNANWSPRTGLNVRSVTLTRPDFVLGGFGTLDKNDNVDLILNLRGDHLDYLMTYLSLPEIGGSVDLAGKLVGPLDRLQLNLNGSWYDLDFVGARIDSGRVQAEARNIRSDDVTARVDIEGRHLDLFGKKFSYPHIRFESVGGTVVVRDFSFSFGDTFITSNFEIEPGDLETEVQLKHLLVQTPHSMWRNRHATIVRLTETSTFIDSLLLESNGHEVGVAGSYSDGEGHCDIYTWGNNLDLALLATTMGAPIRIEGTGEYRARIHGGLDNPDVDLSLGLADGVIDSLWYDRLVLNGSFSQDGYRLDHFRIHNGVDSITISGAWSHRQSPIAMMRSGVSEEDAMSARLTARATSQSYPISSVLKAAHSDVSWGGKFSGEVSMSNTLADPKIELSGVVSPPAHDRTNRLPDVTANLSYSNRVLDIRSISVDDGKIRANLAGRLPVSLGLRSGFDVSRTGPIQLKANVWASDLAIVAGYIDAVAASTGRLEGIVEIGGSAESPRFSGKLDFRDCAFRLAGSNEIYKDIDANITVSENRVELSSLEGRKEKKGGFKGKGWAKLGGFELTEYDFRVDLEDFPFSTISGLESTQEGELTVRSRRNEEGKPVPMIGGSLKVKQAVITRSLAKQEGPPSPITMPVSSPSWLCNLEINAPKNVWVRNPDLQMELGGDLILKRDQQGLYLRGDLNVLRGSYSLYNNKFRITEGRFDFATATTLRPGIYLDAYTPHGRAGEVETRIFLSLSWPADEKEPSITLSYSEPGYSEADIWAMLGGQVVTGGAAFSGEGEWDAGETATSIASNYLERMLNAQMSDYTIAVESRPVGRTGGSATGESELSIAVGRYLSEDLYLNYRQGLMITSARELDVEYRLSNMLLLRSEIIRHSQKGIQGTSRQTTDEINLDIKFRYEY